MAGLQHLEDTVGSGMRDHDVVIIGGEVLENESSEGFVGSFPSVVVEWIRDGIWASQAAIKVVQDVESVHKKGKSLAPFNPVTLVDTEF